MFTRSVYWRTLTWGISLTPLGTRCHLKVSTCWHHCAHGHRRQHQHSPRHSNQVWHPSARGGLLVYGRQGIQPTDPQRQRRGETDCYRCYWGGGGIDWRPPESLLVHILGLGACILRHRLRHRPWLARSRHRLRHSPWLAGSRANQWSLHRTSYPTFNECWFMVFINMYNHEHNWKENNWKPNIHVLIHTQTNKVNKWVNSDPAPSVLLEDAEQNIKQQKTG